MTAKFIGRKEELRKLGELVGRDRGQLVVMKGRRRIGKSRLVEEFAKGKKFISFTGLAPVRGVDAQSQRDAFARQFASAFGLPPMTFKDWSDAFLHLSQGFKNEPTIVLFDEISWMGSKDPSFVPKLKAWWDLVAEKQPNLILIFCGSVSIWIEKNIINSTAFFGRISLQISLNDLELPECGEFLLAKGFHGSVYDQYKVLSVTGGVPWYLEQISPHFTADENIKRLCFEKEGSLVREFDRIFNDLFSSRATAYKKIVNALADGMCDLSELRDRMSYPRSGTLSDFLQVLAVSGFVTKHPSWSFRTGKLSKKSVYRLSDNYLRFFIRYIEPNLSKIETDSFKELSPANLPGWESMIGLQVENLLLKNRSILIKALGINPADIVADNPYLQKPTKEQKGFQIDYLIQTRTHNLYSCEFKFRRREIGTEVIDEIEEKKRRISLPRGFAFVPVLFHLGGVQDEVYRRNYFYRIIDIGEFLA